MPRRKKREVHSGPKPDINAQVGKTSSSQMENPTRQQLVSGNYNLPLKRLDKIVPEQSKE